MEKRYIVKLTAQEREEIDAVLRRGKQDATVIRRAHILHAMNRMSVRASPIMLLLHALTLSAQP
jgi:hypothetical protein